jgi:mRNA-degrading endonuclease RelE of RelBE toxin-antitoxin system
MNILFHKRFEKKYVKLDTKMKEQFKKRRDVFLKNPEHPLLHNHELSGGMTGTWSINITSDVRAHYLFVSHDTVLFIDIDTHHNLYGS